ncbi:MAG: hypothetical protein IJQ68_04270 [Methanobrevibacter sp.]|uniref:hypothetical protein n=1 Tax=Methanobrevibacter sp. TaxID=66852 RepID=UPI0025E66EBD|nr:hypothetical protein [Methanobrevibacter sp.]MBR0271193.1 hypothetical protein [Methanobrevibacter sp.]
MNYNKIILALVIIFVVIAIGGFMLISQQNNDKPVTEINNTSSSVDVDKVNSEDVVNNDGGSQQSGSDSKYVSREYAQQHMDEWNSGQGYYWIGDTQYDSATGKIIGGGSAEDQKALMEVYGDMS